MIPSAKDPTVLIFYFPTAVLKPNHHKVLTGSSALSHRSVWLTRHRQAPTFCIEVTSNPCMVASSNRSRSILHDYGDAWIPSQFKESYLSTSYHMSGGPSALD